jgi:hypothetical protein
MITEAEEFIAKKAAAGKKGMKNRWLKKETDITDDNSVITPLQSVITRSSSSSSNNNRNIKPKVKISSSSDDDGSLTAEFKEFWRLYPRKIGKGDAEKAWKKITNPIITLFKIRDALKWQCESDQWRKNNGEFIPHPSTYLNQRRWEDEPAAQRELELPPWAMKETV